VNVMKQGGPTAAFLAFEIPKWLSYIVSHSSDDRLDGRINFWAATAFLLDAHTIYSV
jgi:hypothetical protein